MITSFRILFFLLLSDVAVVAQTFEGKITYRNSYTCKIPNVTNEMFTSMMGTSLEYIVKGASYKTISNGTFLQWQLYLPKDNKLYTKFSNSPSILWNDGAVNPDEVIKSELNKNVVEILGHACDELVLTCKSGVQKYYFNSKLKMDSRLFENHRFGNFYEYVSKANAVPLKIIIDNVQFALESVATVVQEEKVDDQIFVLPPDAVLEKSPF
ncbi:hypothetical protein [Chryseolinea sp. H1M3-3]|uniref:hypothetical protein n=1 Tax=Chryseolinea sp. H1M3-3 TaxID=3034144 RepID=UPI0023EB9B36|nr:hypothetical protein [Chryseolinea sp. H1M3-3]